MNFNADNQKQSEELKLNKKDTSPKQERSKAKIKVVAEKFGFGFKIMIFFALLATIILVSGTSLYKYKESFTAFGESSLKPIYNKTYNSYTQNMYNKAWLMPCIICISIMFVVCILTLIRRKKYPNVFDYIIFGLSIVPSVICIFGGLIFIPATKKEVVGTPGVLTGHGTWSSSVSFGFVVVAICFIVFAIGSFLILKDKKENSYIK